MDLNELNAADQSALKAKIAQFKKNRDILHKGQLHRLDSDDPALSAEMHIKGDQFLLYVAQLEPSPQQLTRPIRLAGLDPNAAYHVKLQNPEQAHATMNRDYSNPVAKGLTLTGTALMQHGLTLPQTFPDTIWTVTGKAQP